MSMTFRRLAGLVSLALLAVSPMAAHAQENVFNYNNAINGDRVDWTGLYSGVHSGGVSGKTKFVRQAGTVTSSALGCTSTMVCAADADSRSLSSPRTSSSGASSSLR